MEGKSAGIGKSFTTDKKIAEVYGNKGKIIDGFVENKDILRYNELDTSTKKYIKSIIDERIDGVKKGLENENIKPFEELVLEIGEIARIKNKKAIDISSFGIPSESEIRILSEDAIKANKTTTLGKKIAPKPKKVEIPERIENQIRNYEYIPKKLEDVGYWLDDDADIVKFNPKIREKAKEVLEEVNSMDKNAKVYLHGSWTQGLARKESDIDFYVVSNKLEKSDLSGSGYDVFVNIISPEKHAKVLNPIQITKSKLKSNFGNKK